MQDAAALEPEPEPEPGLESTIEPHTPAYRGKVVTRDAHRVATLTPERLELETAAASAQAAAEEARAVGVPAVTGAQRQRPHCMVDAVSDTDSDDNNDNDGRGWSARPETPQRAGHEPPNAVPDPTHADDDDDADASEHGEEAVVELLRSRAALEFELARLQEEERAQHGSSSTDSTHLAVDTKWSPRTIGQVVVSSACPRRPSSADAADLEPASAAEGANDDGTSGRPPRLQSGARKPQRIDIGEWTNRLQGADARRAEYLASRQRKARRGAARGAGDAAEAFDPSERDMRSAATRARPVSSGSGRERAARQQAWRIKPERPSAWAVAPGRGEGDRHLGDRDLGEKAADDEAKTALKLKSGGTNFAAAAARKAQVVAERSAAAARSLHQKQRPPRRQAIVERPPSVAGWSDAPAIFRGDGGYNTFGAQDSIAGADDLRAAIAQRMKEVNDRKNAVLEAKAARIRSARIESEATHRRPASARRSAVTAMAGAWRDGKEDCPAEALMESAAAADAALRKLSEAAALADARRAQAVEARREAARGMSTSVPAARNGTSRGKSPGIGEREAAAARPLRVDTRQPRPRFSAARVPNLPSARVRRNKTPAVSGSEEQRLRKVTEQYESAANGAGAPPARGDVVASEASEDVVARGST